MMFRQKERRQFIRIPEEYLVNCSRFAFNDSKTPVINVNTKNLSASGLLFITEQEFREKDVLKMEIHIPGWEKFKPEFCKGACQAYKPLTVLGSVVRVQSREDGLYDVGICFSAIDDGHQVALSSLLKKMLGRK